VGALASPIGVKLRKDEVKKSWQTNGSCEKIGLWKIHLIFSKESSYGEYITNCARAKTPFLNKMPSNSLGSAACEVEIFLSPS
jgi:hypothetical protein